MSSHKALGCVAAIVAFAALFVSASAPAADRPAARPIAQNSEDPPPKASSAPGPHEKPAAHRPMPVPPALRLVAPPVPVIRGDYVSVQVNVDENGDNIVGDAANEPSIAVDPRNPLRMAIGWRQFDTIESDFRQAGVAYTTDEGRSWTFTGVLDPGVFRSDPVLDADADGNFYYDSLTVNSLYTCDVFKSTDGGKTWGPPVYAYGGDKAWMAIDRTGGVGHGNIYAAWDWAGCCGDDWFNRSVDGGASWDKPVPIPEQPIWGTTTVSPFGEVYIAGRRASTDKEFVLVGSSTAQYPEGPLTFDFATQIDMGGRHQYYLQDGPNPGGLISQAWVACDHTGGPTHGNIYVLCSVKPNAGDDPLDVHFIRSEDDGQTWTAPIRVNDDPLDNGAWQWFGTMSVGQSGRIDAIWADTRDDPDGYDSVVYYSYSLDAGDTWSPNEAITPSFDPHLGWPQQDKLGDYYDMVSDRVGAHLAYAATFNGEQDIYYLRLGDYDCNHNGIGDAHDIADGTSSDDDGDGIPDDCQCLSDIVADGTVDVLDLLQVLAQWGTSGGADVNYDGIVDVLDLLVVLGAWGACP